MLWTAESWCVRGKPQTDFGAEKTHFVLLGNSAVFHLEYLLCMFGVAVKLQQEKETYTSLIQAY